MPTVSKTTFSGITWADLKRIASMFAPSEHDRLRAAIHKPKDIDITFGKQYSQAVAGVDRPLDLEIRSIRVSPDGETPIKSTLHLFQRDPYNGDTSEFRSHPAGNANLSLISPSRLVPASGTEGVMCADETQVGIYSGDYPDGLPNPVDLIPNIKNGKLAPRMIEHYQACLRFLSQYISNKEASGEST